MRTQTPCPPAASAHPAPDRGGFSLIEVLGVLAIAAILFAAVVVAVMQRLTVARQEAEAKTMNAIALAFEKVVLDRKTLPGTNDWVVLLAPELDRAADEIEFTRSGVRRLLIYHPASGLRPRASAIVQTVTGFTNVVHDLAKVIFLSTLGNGFPNTLDPTSGATFTNLWNVEPHDRPAGWTAATLPDPDNVHIARVDLGRLLHRVVLNNITLSNTATAFTMDYNGTVATLTKANSPWQRSYIHGTGLNLHGLDGRIQMRELITEDRTFYCGDGGWGTYMARNRALNEQVVTYVRDFLAGSFPKAENNQRPRASVDEMYRAMWSYMFWAEDGFFEAGNNKKQAPDTYVLRSTVARLNEGTLNLLGKGGSGNENK